MKFERIVYIQKKKSCLTGLQDEQGETIETQRVKKPRGWEIVKMGGWEGHLKRQGEIEKQNIQGMEGEITREFKIRCLKRRSSYGRYLNSIFPVLLD